MLISGEAAALALLLYLFCSIGYWDIVRQIAVITSLNDDFITHFIIGWLTTFILF